MFTGIAGFLISAIIWLWSRSRDGERYAYEKDPHGDWAMRLHIRQDIKLIAFLLGGVIIMLGIIADRIH